MGALTDDNSHLLFAMTELTVAPGVPDFLHAAEQLQASVGIAVGASVPAAEQKVVRCHFYAAVSGHAPSARAVADYAASQAGSGGLRPERTAQAWRMVAEAPITVPNKWSRETAADFLATVFVQ